MSEQPEATEREQEEAHEGRLEEQQEMAGQGHEDPEQTSEDARE